MGKVFFFFQGRPNDINKEFRTAREHGKLVVSPHWLTMVNIHLFSGGQICVLMSMGTIHLQMSRIFWIFCHFICHILTLHQVCTH